MKSFVVAFFLLVLTIALVQAAEILGKLELVKWPQELEIQRGWTGLLVVEVKNSGQTDLFGVSSKVEGINTSWVELPDRFDLKIGENKSLVIRLTIPANATVGNYLGKIVVSSTEARDEKSFVLRVFNTEAERIYFEIQTVKERVNSLESNASQAEKEGKDVKQVELLIEGAKEKIDLAENRLNSKAYGDASDLLTIAKGYLEEAERALQTLRPIQKPPISAITLIQERVWVLLPAFFVVLVILLSVTVRKKYKVGIRVKPSTLKRVVVGQLTAQRLENEREKIEKMLSILEKQYNEGIISKESYEELKSRNKERLAEIEKRLEG